LPSDEGNVEGNRPRRRSFPARGRKGPDGFPFAQRLVGLVAPQPFTRRGIDFRSHGSGGIGSFHVSEQHRRHPSLPCCLSSGAGDRSAAGEKTSIAGKANQRKSPGCPLKPGLLSFPPPAARGGKCVFPRSDRPADGKTSTGQRFILGSSTSRSPSPSRLKPRTVKIGRAHV